MNRLHRILQKAQAALNELGVQWSLVGGLVHEFTHAPGSRCTISTASHIGVTVVTCWVSLLVIDANAQKRTRSSKVVIRILTVSFPAS